VRRTLTTETERRFLRRELAKSRSGCDHIAVSRGSLELERVRRSCPLGGTIRGKKFVDRREKEERGKASEMLVQLAGGGLLSQRRMRKI